MELPTRLIEPGVYGTEIEPLAAEARRPDDVFMLDVCESGGELRLVELNGFICSWLYACDLAAVVERVSRRG
jgi:hypothetical protein